MIPTSERPDLMLVIENLRVVCIPCNSARGDRVTDDERRMVLERIAADARPLTL